MFFLLTCRTPAFTMNYPGELLVVSMVPAPDPAQSRDHLRTVTLDDPSGLI